MNPSKRTSPLQIPARLVLSGRLLLAFTIASAIVVHSGVVAARPAQAAITERVEVRQFIDRLALEHEFDRAALHRLMSTVRPNQRVLKLMNPPAGIQEKRKWRDYTRRFTNPARVRAGVGFWSRHDAAIARASARYGVPAEIIVGIIGVETIYGRYTGTFSVLEALATLAFDFPRRATFFSRELEQFLIYTREAGLDAAAVRGSYAGAIGLPQFMPSSIRHYAVDFDGSGRIDLSGSPEDAIGSVANFLAEHGWQRGEPTHFDSRIEPTAQLAPLLDAGIEPRLNLDEIARQGVHPAQAVPPGIALALIDLPNGDAPPSYYLAARNFYVITRYNRSSLYAMAVIALGQAVREARSKPSVTSKRG